MNNYHNHKILIRQIGERINATIDENNGITTQSVYSLYPKSNLDMRHLTAILGVLNSKLFDFFYHLVAGDKQMFKRIILENIKALPYPNLNSPIVPMLDELIKSFLNKAQDGDINMSDKEERKIDRLVYQLYGLTNAEVRIIDPNEPISGSDDEPFKA